MTELSDKGQGLPTFLTRWRERRRQRRCEVAYWRWQDAKKDHRDWAFGRSPSENHRNEQKVERLEAKWESLRGERDA